MGGLVSEEGDGFVKLLEKLESLLVLEEGGWFVTMPEKFGASFRFSRAWILGLEAMAVFALVSLSGGRTVDRELSELFGFTCGVCDLGRSDFEGFLISVFAKRSFCSGGGGGGDAGCSGVLEICRLGFCLQVTWNSFNIVDIDQWRIVFHEILGFEFSR